MFLIIDEFGEAAQTKELSNDIVEAFLEGVVTVFRFDGEEIQELDELCLPTTENDPRVPKWVCVSEWGE